MKNEMNNDLAEVTHRSEFVELTDEVINNYFKALKQVAQNKVSVPFDNITEKSKESDLASVLEAVPTNSREETELKSMISLLGNETLVNLSKLKSSIEFSERL